MTLDLDALEKVAQEATPGPWEAFEDSNEHLAGCPPTMEWLVTATDPSEDFYEEIIDWGNRGRREDAEHIAAFDPPTVLALISRQREAEKLLDLRLRREEHFKAQRDALQAKLDRIQKPSRELITNAARAVYVADSSCAVAGGNEWDAGGLGENIVGNYETLAEAAIRKAVGEL